MSTQIVGPYGVARSCHVFSDVSVAAAVFALPVDYRKYGLRLCHWRPSLIVNLSVTLALEIALSMTPIRTSQSSFMFGEYGPNV